MLDMPESEFEEFEISDLMLKEKISRDHAVGILQQRKQGGRHSSHG